MQALRSEVAGRMTDPVSLHGELRRYREAGGVPLGELAARLNKHISTLSRMETGEVDIPIGFPALYMDAVRAIVLERARAVGLECK